jgi:ABC-type branched-subunit amino acid transport system substrate-binding protein
MTIGAKAEQAQPIANKLLGDGVKIVVSGSYSGPTRAAAGVFQEAKIPYISSYAIHPDITRAGDFVFRTSFMGEVQGRAGAKLVGEILKSKRVVDDHPEQRLRTGAGSGVQRRRGEVRYRDRFRVLITA